MATNKVLLFKGIKILAITLPLLFMSPVIINSAFKNEEHPYYYPVLTVGIILFLLAIYMLFKGVTTVVKGIFNDPN
mgnify:FL=1